MFNPDAFFSSIFDPKLVEFVDMELTGSEGWLYLLMNE
jgi:hypothetical protein